MVIKAGADGCVEAAVPVPTGECCPPSLGEISYCAMACSFIQLLPSGPLWDRPKDEMLARFAEVPVDGQCLPDCAPVATDANLSCQSLVAYAVYLSGVLMDNLMSALWPAIREANPFTAVTTLDEWLGRLGWEDCYRSACRSPSLGALTPYEIPGICGPIYCPVDLPQEVECAIKRGIVHSLTRAGMGGVRTACWINWVIEPLGGKIEITGDCGSEQITLVPISDTLPACPVDLCPAMIDKPQGTVPAKVQTRNEETCDFQLGLPLEIWPALLSAECIVRSLLPNNLANNVRTSC